MSTPAFCTTLEVFWEPAAVLQSEETCPSLLEFDWAEGWEEMALDFIYHQAESEVEVAPARRLAQSVCFFFFW